MVKLLKANLELKFQKEKIEEHEYHYIGPKICQK